MIEILTLPIRLGEIKVKINITINRHRLYYEFRTVLTKEVSVEFMNEIRDWHMLINLYRYIVNNRKKINHSDPTITNYLILALKKESLKFSTIHNVIDALILYPVVIKFLDTSFTSNKRIMLDVVSRDGKSLVYTTDDLRADKDVVIRACANNGFALKNAAYHLKADKDVIKIAVKQNGLVLRYASKEARADIEIVTFAISQNGNAYQYASTRLRFTKELILLAIKNNCKTDLITTTISTICIPKSNNNYSRCVESIIRSHYNKRIFLFIKHLYGVKCFLFGLDHKNSI
jgi:hypothetical protein